METKNLSKSFGVRVPLGMYMQMLEVSVKNKITITDICLYSLMNSGVLKDGFNFENGGAVNTNHIAEIKRLNQLLIETQKRGNFQKLLEAEDRIKSLEKEMVERHLKITSLTNENKRNQQEIKEMMLRMKM